MRSLFHAEFHLLTACGTLSLSTTSLCPLQPCTHHLACTSHAPRLCPCAPCSHLACLFPTTYATSLCPRRRVTAPRHCTHHLTVPLSPHVPHHCAPCHCTCHLAVPSSPHMPCCHAPHNCTCLLTMPIAATHAAHLTTTMATTTATTPKQREYCNHPHHNYHIVSTMSTTSAMHDHHDKPQPPQPWRAHSGSGQRPSLTCHIGTASYRLCLLCTNFGSGCTKYSPTETRWVRDKDGMYWVCEI